MGEDAEVRVLQGAQQAAGLLLLGEREGAVHGADHQIEASEDAVRQVEAAVLENVHLDALEQGDAGQAFVEGVDLVDLPGQAVGVQAMSDRQVAGVVGDCQVFQPRGLSGGRHFLEAVAPVTGAGMRVQVAAQVVELHQLGQGAGLRSLYRAARLA
ncbi:hypothetical protein D3C75_593920 [compost metagenome]